MQVLTKKHCLLLHVNSKQSKEKDSCCNKSITLSLLQPKLQRKKLAAIPTWYNNQYDKQTPNFRQTTNFSTPKQYQVEILNQKNKVQHPNLQTTKEKGTAIHEVLAKISPKLFISLKFSMHQVRMTCVSLLGFVKTHTKSKHSSP